MIISNQYYGLLCDVFVCVCRIQIIRNEATIRHTLNSRTGPLGQNYSLMMGCNFMQFLQSLALGFRELDPNSQFHSPGTSPPPHENARMTFSESATQMKLRWTI